MSERNSRKLRKLRNQKNEREFWNLIKMDTSFQFVLGDSEKPEKEVFFELAELYAEGEAFEDDNPLNADDVLESLEEECPDFEGIRIDGRQIKLIRKRLIKKGLLLVNGSKKDFYSDKSLSTINFADFYDEHLSGKNDTTNLGLLENGGFKDETD